MDRRDFDYCNMNERVEVSAVNITKFESAVKVNDFAFEFVFPFNCVVQALQQGTELFFDFLSKID